MVLTYPLGVPTVDTSLGVSLYDCMTVQVFATTSTSAHLHFTTGLLHMSSAWSLFKIYNIVNKPLFFWLSRAVILPLAYSLHSHLILIS